MISKYIFNPWRIKDGTRVVASESQWKEPLKWNRKAACDCYQRADLGEKHLPSCPQADRPRVFCASLADVFEDWPCGMVDSKGDAIRVSVSGKWITGDFGDDLRNEPPLVMSDVRSRLFELIKATPNLDWLLLTKRPENIEFMLRTTWTPTKLGIWDRMARGDFSNVWIGTSVEDQETADARIPHLLKVPARVRFLSAEPLIGPVDLRPYLVDAHEQYQSFRSPVGIDWVIIGGESGSNARPCSMEWIRSLVKQCQQAGAACFVKQLGSQCYKTVKPDGSHPPCKAYDYRDPKGGDPDEWPEEISVRQFPKIDSVSSS